METTLFLEVSHITNELEQLEFNLEKIIGIEKHAGKVRKVKSRIRMEQKERLDTCSNAKSFELRKAQEAQSILGLKKKS